MISSFDDAATEDVFHGRYTKKVRTLLSKNLFVNAQRKLDLINAAFHLDDLKIPPWNRLEALHGDLNGMHSIRINDQWRIIFKWIAGHAEDVKIIDYHRG